MAKPNPVLAATVLWEHDAPPHGHFRIVAQAKNIDGCLYAVLVFEHDTGSDALGAPTWEEVGSAHPAVAALIEEVARSVMQHAPASAIPSWLVLREDGRFVVDAEHVHHPTKKAP